MRWNVAGAPCTPKGSTVYWYRPPGVKNAVFLPGGLAEGDLPISLGKVMGGEVSSGPEPLDEFVDPGHWVRVELRDLVQPPKVVAESK